MGNPNQSMSLAAIAVNMPNALPLLTGKPKSAYKDS